MICHQCKATLEDDSRFCKHCGAGVEAHAASPFDPNAVSQAPAPGPAAADASPDIYRDPAHEQELWRGRPAWQSNYGMGIAWLAASILLIVFVTKIIPSDSFLRTGHWWWWVILATAAILFFRALLRVWSVQYRLTSQRLFIHRGLLTRLTDQLELVQVDDVRIRQGLIDQIVNTGDIEIVSTDSVEPDIAIHSILAPAELAESIRKAVRNIRGKGTVFVKSV